MKNCSIIIASYNEANNLKKCLDSIRKLDYPIEKYEIIVVDNNSTDNTQEILEKFHEVICLLEEKKGASCARNKGIKYAKNDILVFIDADSTVSPDFLSKILPPFDNPEIGGIGGEIRPRSSGNIFSEYLGLSLFMTLHRYGKQRSIKGYPSCNLAVRKNIVHSGFDSELLRGQDKDICYKIVKAGYKIIFQPGAIVYHDNPDSLKTLTSYLIKGSLGRVILSKKYKLMPDILFFKFHIPLLFLLTLLFLIISTNLHLVLYLIFPVLAVFFYMCVTAYVLSKKFILSFFIKPIFDAYSIIITYVAFQYISINYKKVIARW